MKLLATIVLTVGLLVSPTSVAQNLTPPETMTVNWLHDLKSGGEIHDGEGVQIVNTSDRPLPHKAIEGLVELVGWLGERYPEITDSAPVTVYYVTYDQYIRSYEMTNHVMGLMGYQSNPRMIYQTHGYFHPIVVEERAIFLYEWSWHILLHEIIHHGISDRLGFNAGIDHRVIDAETDRLWSTRWMQGFMSRVTQGE